MLNFLNKSKGFKADVSVNKNQTVKAGNKVIIFGGGSEKSKGDVTIPGDVVAVLGLQPKDSINIWQSFLLNALFDSTGKEVNQLAFDKQTGKMLKSEEIINYVLAIQYPQLVNALGEVANEVQIANYGTLRNKPYNGGQGVAAAGESFTSYAICKNFFVAKVKGAAHQDTDAKSDFEAIEAEIMEAEAQFDAFHADFVSQVEEGISFEDLTDETKGFLSLFTGMICLQKTNKAAHSYSKLENGKWIDAKFEEGEAAFGNKKYFNVEKEILATENLYLTLKPLSVVATYKAKHDNVAHEISRSDIEAFSDHTGESVVIYEEGETYKEGDVARVDNYEAGDVIRKVVSNGKDANLEIASDKEVAEKQVDGIIRYNRPAYSGMLVSPIGDDGSTLKGADATYATIARRQVIGWREDKGINVCYTYLSVPTSVEGENPVWYFIPSTEAIVKKHNRG